MADLTADSYLVHHISIGVQRGNVASILYPLSRVVDFMLNGAYNNLLSEKSLPL